MPLKWNMHRWYTTDKLSMIQQAGILYLPLKKDSLLVEEAE